ncbi:MAG: helicase HerA domain-containing protein [Candidatus Nanoarchaeia archaeon]
MVYDVIIGRDKSDKSKFKDKGLIYLGKGYVKMGNYTSLSNRIWMDVARTHVVLVAGKRGCLTKDTLVFTDKGYKKMSDFDDINDKILSFDKDKKEFEWENAKLIKYNISNESLLEIEMLDGRKLQLTKEHPMLMNYREKKSSLNWVNANKLKIGDKLISVDNKKNLVCNKIKSIKKIQNINEVYDLSVNKNHSFIANGLISHNSGKSYSLGVIAEELSDLPEEARNNIASLIFDTMGIFWTMKYKNEKEEALLYEWELKSKNLPVNIWVPFGYYEEFSKRRIPADKKFALAVSELEIEDWISTFNLTMTEPISILIQKIILELQKQKEFDLEDIILSIKKDNESDEETKKAASSLFEAAKSWRVFAEKNQEATKINELITPGQTTVLDLSVYSSTSVFNIRALIIGLVSKKLFNQRILARKKEEIDSIEHGLDTGFEEKKETPLVWLFLDEAHEFLPMNEKTPASNALIQLLREGRQPGISLVLATQQPGVIHRDVMTQSDIIISHRLTNKKDLEALNEMMQSYLLEGISKSMNNLPNLKGSAIILDDNSERLYPVRIRPRFTWHGGEAPVAIKKQKDI